MTDLRVQLHKKRQLQQPKKKMDETPEDSLDELDDDKDSLENAQLSDLDNDVRPTRKMLGNRIVQKSSPRKVNIEPEQPKSKIRLVNRVTFYPLFETYSLYFYLQGHR